MSRAYGEWTSSLGPALLAACKSYRPGVIDERARPKESDMSHDEFDETSLEALGIATRRAVHDLNNLMLTILGIVELLDETLPPDDPLHQDLLEIQRAGQRAVTCAKRLHRIGCQLAPPPG